MFHPSRVLGTGSRAVYMRITTSTPVSPTASLSADQHRLDQVFGNAKDPSKTKPVESHLSFTLAAIPPSAERPGRSAMTFRIPRDFVWVEQAYTPDGRLCRVPLRIKLPESMPWFDGPVSSDVAPRDWDDLKRGFNGRYVVSLGTASGSTERFRALRRVAGALAEPNHDLMADGSVHGLLCYSARRPGTDKSPGNVYLTPTNVVDEDAVVAISCSASGCQANFGFEGRGATVCFSKEELANWHNIIDPIKVLIRSFIVRKL
jgi:hypothetical protein